MRKPKKENRLIENDLILDPFVLWLKEVFLRHRHKSFIYFRVNRYPN